MKKVIVSAPGKIILMGEHAVVYGKPALISAINLRLTAAVSDSSKSIIVADEGEEYIHHILMHVCKHFRLKNIPSLRIEIVSDIPIGYHLGSSAALGAALVGALSYHLKKIWNPVLINQLAYESEKYIHINSSGVDPAAVVSGKLIWYRKELDFLRSIWQFPFGIPKALNNFCFVDTGRPLESTGEMVSFVSNKLQIASEKLTMEKLFEENERQTKHIAVAIKEEDEKRLIQAIRSGERTLENVGVVSQKVIPLIRQIEQMGGAAKILGGGGRADGVGFLLCYHKRPSQVAELCKTFRYSIRTIRLGEEGVRLEEK